MTRGRPAHLRSVSPSQLPPQSARATLNLALYLARHPAAVEITRLRSYALAIDVAFPGPIVKAEIVFNFLESACGILIIPYAVIDLLTRRA